MYIKTEYTFIFHTDPGHAWLAVKRDLVTALGLSYKISSYSYQNKTMVYLEEDCDTPLLLDELRARGIQYNIKERYQERSRIRSYQNFDPNPLQLLCY